MGDVPKLNPWDGSEGPMPAEGAYSLVCWRDSQGQPYYSEQASMMEVTEFSRDGQELPRMYATVPFGVTD